MLRFRGSDLSFKEVAVTLHGVDHNPEGIAFSKGCLYIAWYVITTVHLVP